MALLAWTDPCAAADCGLAAVAGLSKAESLHHSCRLPAVYWQQPLCPEAVLLPLLELMTRQQQVPVLHQQPLCWLQQVTALLPAGAEQTVEPGPAVHAEHLTLKFEAAAA